MPKKLFADMVNLIAPEVPGCPDPVIEKALLDIVRTFCTKSTWYRQELAPVAMVEGTEEYAVAAPEGYEATGFAQVWLNSTPLSPMMRRPSRNPSGNTPTHWLYPSLNLIGVYPVPNAQAAGKEVELVAILRPTLDADGADEEIVGRWEEEIVSGVKGKLFSMSKKVWTDLQLSDFHARQFRQGCSRALIDAMRGNTSYRHSAYPKVV